MTADKSVNRPINGPRGHPSEAISTPPPQVGFLHVSSISWPRSGHHLLANLLRTYFGPNFVYCEFHNGHPTTQKIKECCRTAPCKHSDIVKMTKNHDFKLETPQIEGQKYLVQFRDFVPSVVSNFELALRSGLPDTENAFRTFVSHQFGKYLDFKAKWVTSQFGRHSNVLQFPYEDLVGAPDIALALAVRHFAPDHTPDEARIKEVIEKVDGQKVAEKKIHVLRGAGVYGSRNVKNFRYFKPQLFKDISEMTLRREQVLTCFESILGRAPVEMNMIHFQSLASLEKLGKLLKSMPEYKNRLGKTDT